MANANNGNTNATDSTDIAAKIAELMEAMEGATPEEKAKGNQVLVKATSNLSQDERNKARQAERAEALAEKNAKAGKVHAALSAWMRDIGDEVSILARFERYKNDSGVWVWKLQGLSGVNGEKWLPSGRTLKFTYESPTGPVHYPNYVESDAKHPRGTKRACEALLKGIDVSFPGAGSTASTKLKKILEATDTDGNPAGGSAHRHKIEKVWITHEDVNGGKPQKLVEYYLSTLADDEEDETEE